MDRNVVENWLSEGKVYDNFVGELAKTVEKQQANSRGASDSGSDTNVDVAALTRAAKVAFPPEVLKKNVELVLGGSYDWLENKTDKLVINLDLAQEKLAFIDALGSEAATKLTTLPACPAGTSAEGIDLFSATCLPTGTDINAEVVKLKTELANSKEVLPDTSLSADDIKVNVDGKDKTLGEAFANAPIWYGWLKSSPLILTALVLVGGGLIVLLSRPKINGLKKLAWLFGPVGAVLLILGTTSTLLSNQLGNGSFKLDGGQEGIADNLLVPFVKQVSASVSAWNMIIGGAYLVIAAACIVIYAVHKKKDAEPAKEPEEKIEVEPKKEEPKEVKLPPLVQ